MTKKRHIHRLFYCMACADFTPRDEDGEGLCVQCQKVVSDWVDSLEGDSEDGGIAT